MNKKKEIKRLLKPNSKNLSFLPRKRKKAELLARKKLFNLIPLEQLILNDRLFIYGFIS